MLYRKLPKGNEQISILGIGTSSIQASSEEEKDYSILGSFAPQDAEGKCVYCNHCKPCPVGLDIGLINKYYDLAKAGDALAKNHYETLSAKADACIGCGHCNRRCPFHVDQMARMKEIDAYFKNEGGEK